MDNCVFCGIVKGEIPTEFVYRDGEVSAFKDINPKAPVHILIIPNRHISSVNDVEESDKPALGKMFLVAKKIAKDFKVDESGYRLSISNGPDAGQEVAHIHMHIMGGKKLL